MSKIEKIQRYVERNGAPQNSRYSMNMVEALTISHEMTPIEAVRLAFEYGKAKGYRAAKAEARRG